MAKNTWEYSLARIEWKFFSPSVSQYLIIVKNLNFYKKLMWLNDNKLLTVKWSDFHVLLLNNHSEFLDMEEIRKEFRRLLNRWWMECRDNRILQNKLVFWSFFKWLNNKINNIITLTYSPFNKSSQTLLFVIKPVDLRARNEALNIFMKENL